MSANALRGKSKPTASISATVVTDDSIKVPHLVEQNANTMSLRTQTDAKNYNCTHLSMIGRHSGNAAGMTGSALSSTNSVSVGRSPIRQKKRHCVGNGHKINIK
jgi:hypothetical protein